MNLEKAKKTYNLGQMQYIYVTTNEWVMSHLIWVYMTCQLLYYQLHRLNDSLLLL